MIARWRIRGMHKPTLKFKLTGCRRCSPPSLGSGRPWKQEPRRASKRAVDSMQAAEWARLWRVKVATCWGAHFPKDMAIVRAASGFDTEEFPVSETNKHGNLRIGDQRRNAGCIQICSWRLNIADAGYSI